MFYKKKFEIKYSLSSWIVSLSDYVNKMKEFWANFVAICIYKFDFISIDAFQRQHSTAHHEWRVRVQIEQFFFFICLVAVSTQIFLAFVCCCCGCKCQLYRKYLLSNALSYENFD